MKFEEYRRYDALGLAELVRNGEVTSGELVEVALDRAHRTHAALNAVVQWQDDDARSRSRTALSGPFAGVPFLLKDLAQAQAGVVETAGSRAYRDTRAAETDTVVQRWLDSGLVVIGRTAVPEFGAKGVTESDLFGPTRNPWDTTRSPGGSSGGSAAAVAAGVVPAAGANDGGGSIRIPAAYSGLVGLKPGRGIVPCGPRFSEFFHGGAVTGVLTRSVRDSAAMLDVLRGSDPAAPYVTPTLPDTHLSALNTPGPRLRIGMQSTSALCDAPDPEVVDALRRTRTLLVDLGHVVEDVPPPVDEEALARDFLLPWFVNVASEVAAIGSARAADVELDTMVMAELGRRTTAVDHDAALARWHDHVRALSDFHRRFDLLLTPTTATPAPRIGELATSRLERLGARAALALRLGSVLARVGAVEAGVMRNLSVVPFTQAANLTGRPALSVPLFRTASGLPVGSHFVAPPGGETQVLRLARELEEAMPWFDVTPPNVE
ncbi:amidase [Rhodococcus sp. NPDC003994]